MRKLIALGISSAVIATPCMAESTPVSTCLTTSDARALFTFAIPSALDGVIKTCSPALPEDAFMRVKGAETLQRYRAAAGGSWPGARIAFLKVAGNGKDAQVLSGMSDKAMQPFVAEMLTGVVAKDVKPSSCQKIDQFVAALAPVSSGDVAGILATLMNLADGKEDSSLKMC